MTTITTPVGADAILAVREIPLSCGKFAIVDADDYEKLKMHRWFYNGSGYATARLHKNEGSLRLTFMHRAITNAPIGKEVDHINGNTLDNRKGNLRIVSHTENMRNRQSKHGYKGICFIKKRNQYCARIKVDKVMCVGYFMSEIEAACAYDYAAKKYFGEFARLNFPNGQPLTYEQVKRKKPYRPKTSTYKGVFRKNNKWYAAISINNKRDGLGYFDDEIEAAKAYNEAAIKYHGNNAKLNILTNEG